MDLLEEKTLHTEKIFSGNVIALQVDDVELPNGEKSKREIVKHPGAVAIIPFSADGEMYLVEQYRKPLEKTIIEIPAGKMELGEDPLVTARRELEEETGFQSDDLTYLTSFYTSPGFADELLHIYVARDLRKMEQPLAQDADEFINLVKVTPDEAEQLIEQQLIHDAKTMYAMQYWKLQLLIEENE
ncbi:NUDIX hydrolase [Listeria cossartiae subsp. cayugensis]|uniref:NUDIX hydrolase n=1 Tax=Listeria cossartiae subsp. cayugensis TaxID=2713505 RepID=A0ABU2INB0_9LIST|nr:MULTISPECIES: NUDIX hydrolase [Listeria]MDT0049671.1 NUDIX hydrolase [Listeria cossartiae subsp. cayugensis]MDT0066174.1 NUDIX hydrolase [Listeria cossartiae subsp. cayugensis]MDT0080063.1 NUDIX hydrolase [Listeria cossartiae subsp. cayugensis]MDT0083370.1 NUDIX hydrolase [Listeria cossartiae subsp. cayugensis]MDT0088538.1 NUDIX hydrolase [Listeria cossartiae subsp. cayugensis]